MAWFPLPSDVVLPDPKPVISFGQEVVVEISIVYGKLNVNSN